MAREGFYYCPDCNNVFEKSGINTDVAPKCIHPEHTNKRDMTDREFLDWLKNDKNKVDTDI